MLIVFDCFECSQFFVCAGLDGISDLAIVVFTSRFDFDSIFYKEFSLDFFSPQYSELKI